MRKYLIAVLLIVLAACTSSHVVTGTVRAPIEPGMVKIYSQPPENFEEIALLTASSEDSWAFTGQQKMNEVIDDLKKEAAKLGANGILLTGLGNARGDTVAINSGNEGAATYFASDIHKTGKAIAIYVPGK